MSDGVDEQIEVNGFRDDGIKAGVDRAGAILGAHVAGTRDRRRRPSLVRRQAAYAAYQLVPVFARHAEI